MKRILVVCLGNICRSPIGEELIRQHAKQLNFPLEVDSAGTQGWHAGKSPDPRSQSIIRIHGLDISSQKSRALKATDFYDFDIILCMDHQNFIDASKYDQGTAQLALFVSDSDVPDPYYGGESGFADVYNMLDTAAKIWLKQWSEKPIQ